MPLCRWDRGLARHAHIPSLVGGGRVSDRRRRRGLRPKTSRGPIPILAAVGIVVHVPEAHSTPSPLVRSRPAYVCRVAEAMIAAATPWTSTQRRRSTGQDGDADPQQ